MGCGPSSSAKKSAPAQPETVTADGPGAEPAPPTVIIEATPEEKALAQLRLIFDSIDANQDKAASKEELSNALNKDEKLRALVKDAGFNDQFHIMEGLDTNTDGYVTWAEFEGNLKRKAVEEVEAQGSLAAADEPADAQVLKQLRTIFTSIDADEDGTVSKTELSAKLQKSKDENGLMKDSSFGQLVQDAGFNPLWETFDALDTNKDGKITWEEFEMHLKTTAKAEVLETGEVMAAVVPEEEEKDEEVAEKENMSPKACGPFGCF